MERVDCSIAQCFCLWFWWAESKTNHFLFHFLGPQKSKPVLEVQAFYIKKETPSAMAEEPGLLHSTYGLGCAFYKTFSDMTQCIPDSSISRMKFFLLAEVWSGTGAEAELCSWPLPFHQAVQSARVAGHCSSQLPPRSNAILHITVCI